VIQTPGPSISQKEDGAGPWFISPLGDGDRVVLDPSESHHAVRVLRVGVDDQITVTDGAGTLARCVVTDVGAGRVVARVLDRTTHSRSRPQLVVFQGAAKGTKIDDVVGRLAQLGAAGLTVYRSSRTVARWDAAKGARLAQRWSSIARSAAKQSRSAHVMDTGAPVAWDVLLQQIRSETHAVALWEGAREPLRRALGREAERVALVIGSEGGLSGGEATALAEAGARLVSLGPRILRTELAPVAAVTAIQYHYGVIG
jgi:16S rRNA (uracil1498-N3)-methyltransferase